jgi:putative ABC transport system permease protein
VITLKMAYRNIYRQKRRTLLTTMTMLGGFVLASISIAWSDGAYNTVIDLFTRNQLGHIQIHGKGYLDKPTLYNTIDDYESVGRQVEEVKGVQQWAPRIYAAGLASVGDKSAGIRIVGLDPERESATTNFQRKIVEGRMFDDTGHNEAIIGTGLAEALDAHIGDELVVVSQGADGSIANDLYDIIGFAGTDNVINDRTAVYLTLAEAQDLLVLPGRVHEIAIVIDNLDDVKAVSQLIAGKIDRSRLSVAPWQEFAGQFYRAMETDRQGTWISLFVVILIVAVGVFNTVLMTVLERTREYGVLRAIGARPALVSRLVMYEAALMAVISVLIGAVVALGCNYYLAKEGINLGEFTYGGVKFSTMYGEINLRSYVIPAVTVVMSAILVSIFPALRAARTAPARAMRMH